MARRRDPDPAADDGVTLAPPVSPEQRAALAALGYKGPSPSTAHQAHTILLQLRWHQHPGRLQQGQALDAAGVAGKTPRRD